MLLRCVSLHSTECLAAPVPWLLEEGDALEASLACVDLFPLLGIQLDWGEELWLFVVHIPPFLASFELPVSKGIEGIWAKGPPSWGTLRCWVVGVGTIRVCCSMEGQGGDVVGGWMFC